MPNDDYDAHKLSPGYLFRMLTTFVSVISTIPTIAASRSISAENVVPASSIAAIPQHPFDLYSGSLNSAVCTRQSKIGIQLGIPHSKCSSTDEEISFDHTFPRVIRSPLTILPLASELWSLSIPHHRVLQGQEYSNPSPKIFSFPPPSFLYHPSH